IVATNVLYTPETNFNGTNVFSYVITDGSLFATGQVTVVVASRIVVNQDWAVNQGLPDASSVGLAVSQTLSGMSTNPISNVDVRLNISGGYNGDLYGYLLLRSADGSTKFSVLLNRVGRTDAAGDGDAGAGFNVTLSGNVNAGYTNIHDAVGTDGLPTTGNYLADGRAISPNGDFNGVTSTAGLERFNGANANGIWTLFLADVATGDMSLLESWGLEITLGPPGTNQPPILPALPNVVIMAGSNLTVNAAATDPDVPAQTLAYSLMTAPAGASVNPTNGLFAWRPAIVQSPSTNPVVLTVTDSGVPALGATQSFAITVSRPAKPKVGGYVLVNGQLSATITGDRGPDYTVYASSNLTTWTSILTTNAPTLPFTFTDPAANNLNRRFYQIRLGP
ncbi:MAG: hypothetical protein NTZ16_05335, partial [Verrucomicrobia bacterium]|nr:hypothetical protein [Verrucomicrobiota bacterium]